MKEIAVPQYDGAGEASAEGQATEEISSDPTILNAGLTELDDTPITTNGLPKARESAPATDVASVDAGAANEVAEAHWDSKLSQSIASGADGFELIDHPPNAAVSQNGIEPTAAATTGAPSWAEEVPTAIPIIPSATPADDGFHEVSHQRPGRGRGGSQGGPGEYRGARGGRGRGEGRGRGGFRGDGRGRGRGGGGGAPRVDRGRGRGEPAK